VDRTGEENEKNVPNRRATSKKKKYHRVPDLRETDCKEKSNAVDGQRPNLAFIVILYIYREKKAGAAAPREEI